MAKEELYGTGLDVCFAISSKVVCSASNGPLHMSNDLQLLPMHLDVHLLRADIFAKRY